MKHFTWIGIFFLFAYSSFGQNLENDNSVKTDSTKNMAAVLAKELKALGFQMNERISKSVVIGILKNGEGPVVTYCADMDCHIIAIEHACGYAAHVTRLIGVAKAMARVKDTWKGTLLIVGQPAEKSIPMIQASVTDENYFKHSVPQPHYIPQESRAPLVAMTGWQGVSQGLVSEDCGDLEIHNARNDHCYIIFDSDGDFNVDLMAVPFGVKSGVAALLEIFKWATASR
jgi:hypothetical protein